MAVLPLLQPDWPAPSNVWARVTTREGGVSMAPYNHLNLGSHVGDEPAAVIENRRRLFDAASLQQPIRWLDQVHGCSVVRAGGAMQSTADACWTTEPEVACAVLTADCLPVLFCDREGQCVAAAHAGWRGLAEGVLEATVAAMPVKADALMAWLGPAIGPGAFQVGSEVREAFVGQAAADADAFVADGARWRADLFQLARARLARCGVTAVYGGGLCTVSDPMRFFSHRRDGLSGRFASLILRREK